ncbi:hypothetical protein C6P42_000779 [Pichia californica]|nr:hypothetical protein C6P42_000779 [[Candida] californica]
MEARRINKSKSPFMVNYQNGKINTAKTTTNKKQLPSSPNIKTYKSIFDKVFHNRMNFYHRLAAIISTIILLALYLPSKNGKVIFLLIKFIILFIGYYVLQQARILTITTESSKSSNQFQKLISLFCSHNIYILGGAFLLNSIFFSTIIYSQADLSLSYYIETPTRTIKPFVNDNFSFFCFFTLASSIIYTLNFVLAEKYILHIPIGRYRQEPVDYLKNLPHMKILILSILKSILSNLLIPLIYHIIFRNIFFKTFLKPLVFFSDLNYQLPRSDFNFSIYFKLSFYLCLQFLSYDILNEIFNAYSLVGCLVVKKPISHYSETPFQTLLTGIKDYKNPLVRLTAYQELVYLSTSLELQDRQIFYRADNWNLILAEFFFVLTNSARSARSDLPKVESKELLRKETEKQNIKKQASIFGNLNNVNNNKTSNFDFDFDTDTNKIDTKTNENVNDVTVIKHNNESAIFKQPEFIEEKISELEVKYSSLAASILSSSEKIIQKAKLLLDENINLKKTKDNFNANKPNKLTISYQLNLIYTDLVNFIRYFFIGDIYEQSNKRIPNKEIVGFSMVTLTEMLLHAKIEDKNNTVNGTLTESLTLLTKVYKGTAEFLNNPPTDIIENRSQCSIMILNELSISCFFKLVVYYNNILNDLLLPPEVFKLAKWCTDMALEQQREQTLTTNILS